MKQLAGGNWWVGLLGQIRPIINLLSSVKAEVLKAESPDSRS
ncbi:hypothetical protein HanLR1_Chr01g0015531 [Helianthus annuus]|nr:hypothetical protein HanLR1_Chr01g0015531 [Helianthus annuus]